MVKAARYMDTNGDGQVTMEERTSFGRRAGAAMLRWGEKFQMKFDANGDGRLDKQERTALVGGITEEMLMRMAKADADQDGRVNPEEAMEMIEAFGREIGIEPPRREGKTRSGGR